MKSTPSRLAAFSFVCCALLLGCEQKTGTPSAPAQPESFVQVATAQGEVQGIAADGLIEYKGISYAAPPTGDWRWRAPQPPAKRDAVLIADQYGRRGIGLCIGRVTCRPRAVYERYFTVRLRAQSPTQGSRACCRG